MCCEPGNAHGRLGVVEFAAVHTAVISVVAVVPAVAYLGGNPLPAVVHKPQVVLINLDGAVPPVTPVLSSRRL